MMTIQNYLSKTDSYEPLLLCGDCFDMLQEFPTSSVDCIITSPPYFHKREYLSGGIGQEETYTEYIDNLLKITEQLYRVLKPTGSFWLNIGDSYLKQQLLNIPYRLAIKMQDEQGWILRNTVIWDKVKGSMSQSKNNLSSGYEPFFHFTKKRSGYYYNSDIIRKKPGEAKIKDGKVISSTGVSGVSYKRKIDLSTELSKEQKLNAYEALEKVLDKMKTGEIVDFRMVIKGAHQRVTNGNTLKTSGRARELEKNGFYFLFYNPKGSMPSDVWSILPEDSQHRSLHFAPFPLDLVKTPILLTCPEDGVILDPFVGTGTTCKAAYLFKRKSIGIDLSKEYIERARERILED